MLIARRPRSVPDGAHGVVHHRGRASVHRATRPSGIRRRVPGRAYRAASLSPDSPAPLGSRTPPTGAVGITAAAPVTLRVRRAVAGDADLVPDDSLGDVRRLAWSAPVCPPLTTRSSMARMPSAARSTAPTSDPSAPRRVAAWG